MFGQLDRTLSRCTSALNAARARGAWRSPLQTRVSAMELGQAHTNVGEKLGEALIRRVMQMIVTTLLTHQMMRSMTFVVFALGMCLEAVGAEGGGLQPHTKGARRHVFKVNL